MPSKNKKEEPAVKEPVMYIGPTASKSGLVQNTVYTDVPETSKKLFEDVPLSKNLLINVKDYAKAEREINGHKGILWQAFLAVLEYNEKSKIGGI